MFAINVAIPNLMAARYLLEFRRLKFIVKFAKITTDSRSPKCYILDSLHKLTL